MNGAFHRPAEGGGGRCSTRSSNPPPTTKERGIPIVINTDAHSTNGFAERQYGIDQARRAGVGKKDGVNTRTLGGRKLLRMG